MKIVFAFVVFFVCVIFKIAQAQSATGAVEGLVIDSASLQPVRGATIIVEGTPLGAISRDSGQWIIKQIPPGDIMLRVRAAGYRIVRQSVHVRSGSTESVFFSMTVAPLDDNTISHQQNIIVTASKHVQAMQEVPISTDIVTSNDVTSRNAVQLDQVLRYVPGVNLNDTQVNIRGSSGYSRGLGSRVMFLIDGVPMLAGDTGEMKLDALPMVAIDRVEVVKGAGSALYGSSALGGVVNIVTRNPEDSLHLYAKIYGGGYPAPSYTQWQWYTGIRTQAGIDGGFSKIFDGTGVTAYGGFRDNNSYRQNDDYHRWNFYTKLDHDFSPQLNAQVSLNAANDNHGNWIYWQDAAHALLSSDSATLYQRIYSFKMQTSAIVKYAPSENLVSWFRAGFYRTNVDDNINALGPDSASKLSSHANAFSIEEQISQQLTPKNLLTYGVQSTGNVVQSNYYGDRSQWDAAAYAQLEQHPTAQMLMTLGLRGTMARTEDRPFDGRIDPKFGWSYQFDEDFSLRASAGTGFREPSIGEKYVATRTATLITLPNPDLQFEHNVSYEIGGTKTWRLGETPVTLDGAVFWSDYWNMIEPNFVCALPAQIRFDNVTRARIQGLDSRVTAPLLNDHFSLSLAYTYMWARDLNLNEPLKYRPRHLFTAGLNTKWGAAFGGIDFRFASRAERIDDTVALCINPLTGYSVIPDFDLRVQTLVTDARIGIDLNSLLHTPLLFTLNVFNLFQYYYVEIPANLAPIRNFVCQIEYRF